MPRLPCHPLRRRPRSTVTSSSPTTRITGWAGWATNGTTLEEATHIALGKCQVHGPGRTVASWSQNGCTALALGPHAWAADWGMTPTAAQNGALAKISSGRVVEVQCAGQ